MARKKKPTLPKPVNVPLPFKILIDNQEKRKYEFIGQKQEDVPYSFEGIESNSDNGNLPYLVQTEKRWLGHLGDYSLDYLNEADREKYGPMPKCVIERKSKADLYTSFANRDNMEQRICRQAEECEFSAVVIEAEWLEIFTDPPKYQKNGVIYTSKLNPTMIHRSIQSWSIEYRNVHWFTYPGREAAESATFQFLYRFWEKLKKHQTDRQRKTINYETYHEGMKANRNNIPITECPYPRAKHVGDLADWWCRGWIDMADIMSAKTKHRTKCSEPPEFPSSIFYSDYERKNK